MLLKWGGCKASFQKVGDTCKTSILRKNLSSSNFSRLPFGEGFKSAHSLCSKINITREWMDNTIMTRRISAVDKVDKNGKKKNKNKISTSLPPLNRRKHQILLMVFYSALRKSPVSLSWRQKDEYIYLAESHLIHYPPPNQGELH